MAQINGKQLLDLTITTVKIAANAVTSAKVDASVLVSSGANPLTGNLPAGGFKITGLADPTNPGDAATKNYVDATSQGLDIKGSMRVATTVALPANSRTGNVLTASANGALSAQDGVTLVLNDRILVKNEATSANNGLYFVSDVGSAGTPFTLTRTTDADTSAKVTSGLFIFIEEGTTNDNSGWVLATNNPITLNTTSLSFVQFSGAGSITAGNGLTKTGNTLDVVIGATSAGLTANVDDISINYTLVGTLAAADAAAAAAGTDQTLPRGDHKHQVSTAAPSTAITAGASAATGTASTLLRSDATFNAPLGTPVDVGSANAAGAAGNLVGANHVHRVPRQVTANKNLSASVTTTDNDSATATTVASPNALGGYVGVRVNGIHYLVGDATKVSVDTYFSGDGGVTARAMSDITTGDTLRWNGSIAGFQLAATDRIDFLYESF